MRNRFQGEVEVQYNELNLSMSMGNFGTVKEGQKYRVI